MSDVKWVLWQRKTEPTIQYWVESEVANVMGRIDEWPIEHLVLTERGDEHGYVPMIHIRSPRNLLYASPPIWEEDPEKAPEAGFMPKAKFLDLYKKVVQR